MIQFLSTIIPTNPNSVILFPNPPINIAQLSFAKDKASRSYQEEKSKSLKKFGGGKEAAISSPISGTPPIIVMSEGIIILYLYLGKN